MEINEQMLFDFSILARRYLFDVETMEEIIQNSLFDLDIGELLKIVIWLKNCPE